MSKIRIDGAWVEEGVELGLYELNDATIHGVEAAKLIDGQGPDVNGYVFHANSSAETGYGMGQAFLVLEEGTGDATDSSDAGSVLYRVDRNGSVGMTGGLHVATNLRQGTDIPNQSVWISPYSDLIHVVMTRASSQASPFIHVTGNGGTPTLFQLTATGRLFVPTMAVATPAYSFVDDPDTGMTNPSANKLSFSAGGTEKANVQSDGFRTLNGWAAFMGSAYNTCVYIGPDANNVVGAIIRAFSSGSSTADLLRIEYQNQSVLSRFDKNGYFMTRKTTAPADADLAAGETSLWFDPTNGSPKVMFKAKETGATVRSFELNLPGVVPKNTQTGTTYTLAVSDSGKVVESNNGTTFTLTVPTNASVPIPVDTVINLCRYGSGTFTVTGEGGVNVRTAGVNTLRSQYSEATLRKRDTDEWILSGDLG